MEPPPLQNHLGDRELPVRSRRRHALEVSRLRAASPSYVEQRRRLWPLLVPFALFFVLLVPQAAVRPDLPGPLGAEGAYVATVCVLVLALGIAIIGFGVWRDRSLPVREQQRYHALCRTPRLSTSQQELLALDAHADHAAGWWNSSLEPVPAWRCLPEEVRRRHEHTGRSLFLTLPPASATAARADLDEQVRIASATDLEGVVADVLSGGGHTALLARTVAGAGGDAAMARLASLTGEDEWSLREGARPADGRPSGMLRGADAAWVVGVVRRCYVAELVDADRAWQLLELAGRAASTASDGWEGHWRSCRTALALASDSLERVQAFDASLARLRASDWPASRAPWPARESWASVGGADAHRGG